MNIQKVVHRVVANLMACFKAFLKAGVMASVVTCTMASTTAQASDLSDKLQSTDYVLLMRHTRAPGIGDPANYTLDDCKTQRNLSDEGRKQAVAVGHWLKKQGVQTANVHTSAWCRCKDTAELLRLGPVTLEPTLASFFDDMAQAKTQNQKLEKFIATQLSAKRQTSADFGDPPCEHLRVHGREHCIGRHGAGQGQLKWEDDVLQAHTEAKLNPPRGWTAQGCIGCCH